MHRVHDLFGLLQRVATHPLISRSYGEKECSQELLPQKRDLFGNSWELERQATTLDRICTGYVPISLPDYSIQHDCT